MSQAGALSSGGGSGGGTNLQKVAVQSGTSPVVPDASHTITFNGSTTAAGTTPVQTVGTGPNTMVLDVQLSQAIASTNSSNVGLAAFNSAEFTVDSNGFVSLSGGGGSGITTIDGDTGSVTGSTVSLKGNATAGSSVLFSGSGTAMTFNVTDASNNTYIGLSSGPASIPGSTNTGLGYNTLTSLTSGNDNVALGANALNSLSSGSDNCVIGNTCGQHLASGIWNVLLGSAVMRAAATGSHNVAMGTTCLINLASGSYNTVFGDSSGTNYAGSESSNILISNLGVAAESNVIRIGTQGTGNGQQNACYVAGINNTNSSGFTSPLSVFVDSSTGQLGYGSSGGSGITTIHGDTGSVTGSTVTFDANSQAGSSVSFFGSGTTMSLNTTDSLANTIIGSAAGNGSLTGIDNTGLGNFALQALTNGGSNTVIGYECGESIAGGSSNTGIGALALMNVNSGSSNTAVGENSLSHLTTGTGNTCVGVGSGANYTSSESTNICIGNGGITGDSSTIRVGSSQSSCFIKGIASVSVSNTNMVTIDTTTGQLGSQAISSSGFTTINIQTFTSSGTYTPTASMKYCIVEVVGGGGGGGGAAATGASQTSVGAGAGSGEIARGVFSSGTIGVSQTVTIGAAGAANSGATGGNGGNSSLGALISANGGTAGITVGATIFASQQGSAGGTGGSGGSFRSPGVTGTYTFANPGQSLGWSGAGGSSPYGSGGQGITNTAVAMTGVTFAGNAALGYGSGGGGGINGPSASATIGGAGTAGIVIVTEFI